MNIQNIIEVIEEIAPLSGQAVWDKSGMQVAREGKEIKKVAVFLDPVPEIIKLASSRAQFLLSHHPLALKPELPSHHNNWYYSLRELFLANACLYAAHTSLDVVLQGPAGWMGDTLGLKNLEPLEPAMDKPGTGYGGIGDLSVPESFNTIIQKILKFSHCETGYLCGPNPEEEITRIAFCGGSGASLVPLAVAKGAQLYITGDVKHHAAIDAPIPVLDVGHHSLEEEMMRRFSILLQKRIKNVKIEFIPSRSPFSRIDAGE